jgi:hypothetical protein
MTYVSYDSPDDPYGDPNNLDHHPPLNIIEIQVNKGLIVTKDAMVTAAAPWNAVGADPYINPIYGKKYKLPDKGDIYRFIDNNVKNNRFLINIQCWDLPNHLKLEMRNYIYDKLKIRYDLKDINDINNWLNSKNISIDKSAVFIRYIYIYNNNNYLLFDLEKFNFINKSGNIIKKNQINEEFSIAINNNNFLI